MICDPLVAVLCVTADAAGGAKTGQHDLGSAVVRLDRFVPEEVGAEVLLVVVGEDGGHNSVFPQIVLRLHGGQKIRPELMPTAMPNSAASF
jgi:hypothetical protein